MSFASKKKKKKIFHTQWKRTVTDKTSGLVFSEVSLHFVSVPLASTDVAIIDALKWRVDSPARAEVLITVQSF